MIPYPNVDELDQYQKNYVGLVSSGTNLFDALDHSYSQLFSVLNTVDEDRSKFRYQPDKWSIKTLVMHIIDTERIFQYRALFIARGEQKNLLSFDENIFAIHSMADQVSYSKLLEEFSLVAQCFRKLFENMHEPHAHLVGMANGSKLSAATIGFLAAGHRLHHLKILAERYFI